MSSAPNKWLFTSKGIALAFLLGCANGAFLMHQNLTEAQPLESPAHALSMHNQRETVTPELRSPAIGYDTTGIEGPTEWTEREWSEWIASQMQARHQVRTHLGKYCDIATQTTAYEVEWAEKWTQAVGQSGQYANHLNLKPGIILLVKGDQRLLIADCDAVCEKWGIELIVQKVP